MSDSACKTPQPVDYSLDHNKENLPSPNTPGLLNSSIHSSNATSTQQSSMNNFSVNNITSNTNSSMTTTLTKASVVQLKPFDSNLNNVNTGSSNPPFYHLLDKQPTLSSGLLSRDNSTLYAQSSKYITNDNLNMVIN